MEPTLISIHLVVAQAVHNFKVHSKNRNCSIHVPVQGLELSVFEWIIYTGQNRFSVCASFTTPWYEGQTPQ